MIVTIGVEPISGRQRSKDGTVKEIIRGWRGLIQDANTKYLYWKTSVCLTEKMAERCARFWARANGYTEAENIVATA